MILKLVIGLSTNRLEAPHRRSLQTRVLFCVWRSAVSPQLMYPDIYARPSASAFALGSAPREPAHQLQNHDYSIAFELINRFATR